VEFKISFKAAKNNHDALLRDETENYIITNRYVFISGRRPGIRTMAV
jgi:hypothetical protein